ncbi:hypothetical protein ABH926_010294 [Catenulispora sp. GP43]
MTDRGPIAGPSDVPAPFRRVSTASPTPHVIPITGGRPFGERAVLIHSDGVLPEQPDRIRILRFDPDGVGGVIAPGQALDQRCGYLDHTGSWLAEPAFDDSRSHSAEGLARIRVGERWGYADRRGEVAIEPAYAQAAPFSHGLAAIGREGRLGFIDVTGRMVVPERFHRAGPFAAVGLAVVQPEKDGGCGYIDTSGELVIEPRFERAEAFGPDGVAPVQAGNRYGLIDRDGQWVIEPKYYWIQEFNAHGLARFTTGDLQHTGYLNSAGEVVIAEGGTTSDTMAGGLLVCRSLFGYRFFDATGAEPLGEAFGNDFSWVGPFSALGVTLALNDEWGVLHTDGRFIPVEHREPRTHDDGWIPGFAHSSGLAPFLAENGDTVYVDAEGRDVCRAAVGDGGRSLTLRTVSAASKSFTVQEPVFSVSKPLLNRDSQDFFLRPEARTGDVAAIADELIAQEPREFVPYSLVFDGERDVYDLDEVDEDDLEYKLRTGALEVLAQSYVGEGPWGEYPFLMDEQGSDFSCFFAEASKQLTARFGEPTHGREDGHVVAYSDSGLLDVWRLPDGRQLVLQIYANTGDGDFEFQLWLAVVNL